MVRFLKTALFSLFAVAGLGLSAYSLGELFKAYESKGWPRVTGRILQAECRSSSSRPATSARRVTYAYRVGGIGYRGGREQFGLPIASDHCLAEYRAGQAVGVYHDPGRPGVSVLKPGVYRNGVFGLVVGLVFAAFGVGGYRYDRRFAT